MNILAPHTIQFSKGTETKQKFAPVRNTSYAIGIDIGGSHISAGIINQNGKIINKKSVLFTNPPNGKRGTLIIEQLIKELIYSYPKRFNNIYGIGISCPGSIDFHQGTILANSPNLSGWKGMKIKQIIESIFKIPVIIDNDANLAGWGEKYWGAGKNIHNLICITIGTGVGGGIIINDKIYRGSHFYAGEIGHMKIKFDGPLCSCGKCGCLESLVSGPAIVREFIKERKLLDPKLLKKNQKIHSAITARTVFDAARRHDKIASKIIYQTACYLGYAISSLINIFDPEMIVIGGGIAQAGKIIFHPIHTIVRSNIMTHPFRSPQIVPAKLGENAGLLGAAAIIFNTKNKK
jgi:glucokinase